MTVACFLTDTLNWQVLWNKEKYLLNSLFEKLSTVNVQLPPVFDFWQPIFIK